MVFVKCKHEHYSDLRSLESSDTIFHTIFTINVNNDNHNVNVLPRHNLSTNFRTIQQIFFVIVLFELQSKTLIQSVIFKLLYTDLHLLFRYFRISKFFVGASTGNINWLSKQCCPSALETSETTRKPILKVTLPYSVAEVMFSKRYGPSIFLLNNLIKYNLACLSEAINRLNVVND
jgi:hypothetical protein